MYATKQDIVDFFGGALTISDGLANRLIFAATEYIDLLAGRSFEIRYSDEVVSLEEPTQIVYLNKKPVLRILHIFENTGSDFNPEYDLVDPSSYFLINDSVVFNRVIGDGLRKLRIQYFYGSLSIPSYVHRLCVLIVAKDILNMVLQRKSYNDEGDIDLGSIKLSKSFQYSINLMKNIDEEITRLKEELFRNFKTYY
ncbi:MAG: hypothetical protein QXN68_00435 [Thermoplasmata archaeon]